MTHSPRMYQPLPMLVDDLVSEILALLPVKLLLRFKCVSKSWYNLIKSDAFISLHFRKHQSNDKLMLMRRQTSSKEEPTVLSFHDLDSPQLPELWPSLSTSTRFQNREYGYRFRRLIGPCNGLVLVVDQNDVFICNPSLRELKPLPPCPFTDHRGYQSCSSYGDVYRDVDVDRVVSGWGFGSTCAHDFSIVHLQSCYKIERNGAGDIVSLTSSFKAHLYKSTTSTWKDLGDIDTMFSQIGGFRISELFFNGACHWHTELVVPESQLDPGVILTFNLRTETFGQLEYPKNYIRLPTLMVLNDCLAFIWCWSMGTINQSYKVYVMKEYGNKESWSRLVIIGPHAIERPLLFWENEVLIEIEEGQLASCSLATNEIKKFPIHGIRRTLRAVTYKESLISLKTELDQ